jgi:hypothetical protein
MELKPPPPSGPPDTQPDTSALSEEQLESIAAGTGHWAGSWIWTNGAWVWVWNWVS